MVYYAIRFFSRFFFRWYLGLRVKGRERLRRKGAFILAANHTSYLDPLLLATCTVRKLHFIARDKLFKIPIIGWVIKSSGSLSVRRHGPDIKTIKKALDILKKGDVLAIFPEATRAKDKQLKRGKPGAGFLAYKAGVPVVPVYIHGSFDAMPRSIKTLKRRPVKVFIGKPIDLKAEYSKPKSVQLYQEISDRIMREIALLKQGVQ